MSRLAVFEPVLSCFATASRLDAARPLTNNRQKGCGKRLRRDIGGRLMNNKDLPGLELDCRRPELAGVVCKETVKPPGLTG